MPFGKMNVDAGAAPAGTSGNDDARQCAAHNDERSKQPHLHRGRVPGIQRCSMATNFLSIGPTNSDWGRIRRLFDICSSTCAVQPNPRDGKSRREHVAWETHRRQHRRRVELDVGVEAAIRFALVEHFQCAFFGLRREARRSRDVLASRAIPRRISARGSSAL